jgi:hypothetical protein
VTGTALIVLMLASWAACSGSATPGGTTPPPPPDAPAQASAPDSVALASPALCDRMVAHAVELAVPPELTPEERRQLERETAAKHRADCLTQDANVIECAVAAPSLEELAACSGHAE